MSQIYYIGDVSSKGTYYFHSLQLRGWVVSDLDIGKCSLHNRLAIITVSESVDADAVSRLEKKAGLGQEGERWLIDGDDLVPWLRDHGEATEVLIIYNEDDTSGGYYGPVKEVTEQLVAVAKKMKKKYKE